MIALLALFAAGAAIGLYAWLAKAKTPAAALEAAPSEEPWQASTGWTAHAGEEFSGLSEAARCDLIFAVSDLHDERSGALLAHALDDPSDAVALAAAHALGARGEHEAVEAYAQSHPGARAQRILDTLALLR
ncbi:MAG: hypothetical protein ABR508_04680 [Candidatus Baltobacteraceae bacterium]